MDLRTTLPREALFPRPLVGVSGEWLSAAALGVEVVFGPSVTLRTAAGDTMVPDGTPLGVAAKLGVCGVMRLPDGFFQVQMR